jgi:hypothetical protein
MSDRWDYYLTTKKGKPASLFVDIGVAQEAPKEGYGVRLAVLVKQKAPRPDGLTTKEEADRLWPLEDALVPAVQAWAAFSSGASPRMGTGFFLLRRIERRIRFRRISGD